jgi:dolichyl-diphosphooligosaccharide--protein glycosyltransferase
VTRRTTVLLLLAAAAGALLVRMLGAEEVFRGEDVVFRGMDAYYHARRALYSLVHFPELLQRDAYLNFPYGSAVPWPPFYDLLLAALAKLLGGGQATLDRVGALLPPLFGTLLVLPVFFVGRAVGGRDAALLAAGYVALLNAAVGYARVGFADHHAWIALLGATLLALVGAILGRSLALSWGGSVLVFVFSESALVAAAALEPERSRRARFCLANAASCLLTAALLVVPARSMATTADYGASPILFTTFQPILFTCLALLCLALEGLARVNLGRSAASRLALALALASLLAAAGLTGLPSLGRGLQEGLHFMASTHIGEGLVLEEMPLFAARGVLDRTLPERLFGYAIYFLPLVPLALAPALRDPSRRRAALLFAVWFLGYGALSLTGVRWTNEFAYTAAVGLALLTVALDRLLAKWLRAKPLARRFAVGVVVAMLLLPVLRVHAERATGSFRGLRGAPAPASLESVTHRFAQEVRLATPETSGFLDAGAAPEYGIFTWSGIGHALQYVARRPTPADNFGRMIGLDDRNFRLSSALYLLDREEPAVRILDRLGTPYLVVPGLHSPRPDLLVARLHGDDGSARNGRPAFTRFRLLLESVPLSASGGFLKLFERVEGALLEIDSVPEAAVEIRVRLLANSGRSLVWRAETRADLQGQARVRLPYATRDSRSPTVALGSVVVDDGVSRRRVEVPEQAVREGAVIPVPAAAALPRSLRGR